MQKYFVRWKSFVKHGVLNEMRHVVHPAKSKKIFEMLPEEVKQHLLQNPYYKKDLQSKDFVFDFGFETIGLDNIDKFIIQSQDGTKYFYDDKLDNIFKASEDQINTYKELPYEWVIGVVKAAEKNYSLKQKSLVSERNIRNNKDKSLISNLCVFDFDGTLFKSPEKPDSEGNSWWLFAKSLDVPAAPHIPGNEWWYNKTVDLALEKIKDPNTYCIMLTGRSERFLEKRINELLLQKKMLFDEVGLNDSGEESENFKIARINEIIKSLPKLQKLEMWEDQKDLANKYSEEFNNKPYKFVIHIIDDSYSKSNKKNIKLKIKINL
jgi:hypothetical protein